MASKNDDQTDAVQNVVLRAAVRHNWSDARIGMISRLMQKGGITSEISPHKPALRMRQPPEADNYNIFNFVKHDIPVGAVKDDGLKSATSPIQTARSALPRMMQPRNSGSALADMEPLKAAKSAMPSAAHYLVEKRGPYVKTAFMSTPGTPIPEDRPGPGSGEESGITNELGQPSSQMLEAARKRLRCSTQHNQALTGRLASLTPSAADLDLFPSHSTSAVLPNLHRPSEPTLRVHEDPDFGSGNLDSNEGSQLIRSDLQSPLPGLADQVVSDSLVHGLNSGRSSMFQSQGATQNIDVSIASPRGTPVSIAETTLKSNFRSSSHRLAASGLASSLSPLKTATGHFVIDRGSLSQRGRSRISFLSQSQLDPRGSVASASAVEVVDYKLFHGSMTTSLAGNVGEVAGMESVQECAGSYDGGSEGSPQEPSGFTPVVDPMLEYMRRSMIQPTSQKTPNPSLGKVGVGDKDRVLSSAGTSYTPSSGIKPRGSPDNFLNKRRVSFQKPDNSTLDKVGYTSTSDKVGHTSTSDKVGHTSTSDKVGYTSTSDKVGHTSTSDKVGYTSTSDKVGHTSTSDKVGHTSTPLIR
ncbi:hypothetical protein CEUSTIGMA_g2010.t1 [Chlamydomonas eustigma]|uniref:Uncharacterized protein n=1 Tax=Chlamydomonas eustigma TaxID=1157962 RepID=A0A250WUS6_9CHLO|nr:hypothetical protein CEUSTIGMA_g2010.t1 [Chlamydomonas eustigma]|eukprot:GAX74561.1 hypothetical protein CEUSTIGMA_g2010.t1 [Chlamydomonas eustigma]